jgi:peptide/nickel transport system permease protein
MLLATSRPSNWSPLISELKFAGHLFLQNRLVLTGCLISVAVLSTAILAPIVIPQNVVHDLNTPGRLAAPSSQHWLGTDDYGRDLLLIMLLAVQVDISAALIIVISGVIIGVLFGAVAGFVGGKVDEIMMRITDIFLSFPFLILALAIAAVLGKGVQNVILAVVIVQWSGYTRLLRGQVLAEKGRLYVEALRALGIGKLRIILRHLIPNTIYPIIVQATLDVGGVLLTFGALSFLGFGVNPLDPELGRLIANGQTYIFQAPWLVAFPGLAILIISLGFNLLGDGIRDILDPRLRR